MKRIKSSRIITPEGLVSGYVYLENGKITEISAAELPVTEEFDVGDHYVSPGFIDLHTHGGGGHRFEGSVEEVIEGSNFHLKHGTTSICPTVSAAYFDAMAESVKNIAKAMQDYRVKSNILGAHLEGPYLSTKQTGAQGAEFITPPKSEDYLPLLKEYGQYIARWSYAPENDQNNDFCKALKAHAVLPAAGHTDAVYDDIKSAMGEGMKLITHLYSCTSTITRDHGFRRLGVIESAFLEDDLFVEIIADGKHLPPELIKLIYKIKGSDRILLITDSLALAGTDVKRGKMQSTEFIIEDGVCKLLDRSAFAGSIATADRLVRVITTECNIPLTEAIKMMCETPAKLMGLHKGQLKPGFDADIAVFDDDIQIQSVFVSGKQV